MDVGRCARILSVLEQRAELELLRIEMAVLTSPVPPAPSGEGAGMEIEQRKVKMNRSCLKRLMVPKAGTEPGNAPQLKSMLMSRETE
ncbi:hypothetical protein EYF80_000191 [Liparis tanakae]|uniref:Uncharacterized protein n=1 Tax=Liparis tanakae TaxID=230148 RepID=A0A4Z2JIY0_9TELE|nr:hypothetical protein EYF80_000191 [Liparis tanakae]